MIDGITHVKAASSMINAAADRQVAEVSSKIFGRRPKRMAFPGGKSRFAFLVDMGDAVWVFAKRENAHDAQMEARVLQSLGGTGLTPHFKALSDQWTVQEYIPGQRLPVVLDAMQTMEEREATVRCALEALVEIQHVGQSNGLVDALPVIGGSQNWFARGVSAARHVSERIGIAPPQINEEVLAKTLSTDRDEFIKFDARPGNVLMDGSKAVWFDWEDCGRGKAVEDLAFVLFDEWMCLDNVTEDRLIEEFLPWFSRGLSTEVAYLHLVTYGTVHMSERMQLCLKYNAETNGWWDRTASLNGDKAGNTPTEMARMADRLVRLADILPETRGYSDWAKDIKSFYKLPDQYETPQFAQAA